MKIVEVKDIFKLLLAGYLPSVKRNYDFIYIEEWSDLNKEAKLCSVCMRAGEGNHIICLAVR